jgi:hypothetical protein
LSRPSGSCQLARKGLIVRLGDARKWILAAKQQRHEAQLRRFEELAALALTKKLAPSTLATRSNGAPENP